MKLNSVFGLPGVGRDLFPFRKELISSKECFGTGCVNLFGLYTCYRAKLINSSQSTDSINSTNFSIRTFMIKMQLIASKRVSEQTITNCCAIIKIGFPTLIVRCEKPSEFTVSVDLDKKNNSDRQKFFNEAEPCHSFILIQMISAHKLCMKFCMDRNQEDVSIHSHCPVTLELKCWLLKIRFFAINRIKI